MIVIFDMDGTLSDCAHRLHYINKPDKTENDWSSFFKDVFNDEPIKPMVEMFKRCANAGDTIIICTGRDDLFGEELTLAWLDKHGLSPTEAFFRKSGDHRPDDAIKKEMLDIVTEKYGKPDIVFEDRERVVKMWRDNGVFCCQVADGEF